MEAGLVKKSKKGKSYQIPSIIQKNNKLIIQIWIQLKVKKQSSTTESFQDECQAEESWGQSKHGKLTEAV